MNELRNDKNLQEAVSRREQKLPPLPADLNERLMQRLEEPATAPAAKQKRLWLYAAVAVAASIALLIVFNFRQEQTPQEPVVAQQTDKQVVSQPVSGVPEPVEEPEPIVAEAQPAQKSVKKQRKVVMQLVELIPTSEAAPTNVKTLPESLIAKVKAYDQQSDPSRMTGIDDDTDAIVTITTSIEDTDPLVAMAAQVENIRQRGLRLQQEIDKRIDN
jgi:cytoskeletal protein RodZ